MESEQWELSSRSRKARPARAAPCSIWPPIPHPPAAGSGSCQGSPFAGFLTPKRFKSAWTFSLGWAPTESQYLIRLALRTVRASTLRELGGWNPRSVTEDTDLTLRVHLAGWRVRYDVTAVDAEEAVGTVSRYWRQRHRWARGHQQAWRDYRRAVWQSRHLSRSQKVETTMFLLTFHLPVLAGLGLVVLALWLAGLVVPPDPLRLFLLWTLLFLGPLLELGAGLLVSRTDRREAFALAWFLPLFFISISLCCAAWVEGVAGLRSPWAKTARAGDAVPRGTGS